MNEMGKWVSGAAALLTLAITAGCSFGGGQNVALDAMGKDETATIRVMYYDERSFFSQYGMLFSALHPNITVEVVSTQSIRYEDGVDYEKEREKFIEEEQPDILLLSETEYAEMAEEGKLYDLEPVMAQDGYDTETLMPGLIDYLKELGGGKLYGMAPSFYSQAIFYNKDLFDEYGIPYPTDRMSWTDILQLAQRFPTDGSDSDRVYGYKGGYGNGLFELGSQMADTQELKIVNPDKQQVTIDTEGWRETYEMALAAIQSDALYFESMDEGGRSYTTYEDYLLQDPFISGRVAMMIESTYMVDQIKEAQNYMKDDDRVISNWAVVTTPVNPQNPEYGTNMSLGELFAVNAQSPNLRAAWELIKYVSSDEFAKVSALSGNGGQMSTRTTYMKDEDGRNLAAFYALKPSPSNRFEDFAKLPSNFYSRYYELATQELQPVQDGTVSVSEALQSLQEKLQQALLEAIQEEEAKAAAEGTAGGEADSAPESDAAATTGGTG